MKFIFTFAETNNDMASKVRKTSVRKGKKQKPFLVNVDPDILELVRQHKEKTGVQIGKFYDIAATEKLEAERLKK
jgi:hypothetical protein